MLYAVKYAEYQASVYLTNKPPRGECGMCRAHDQHGSDKKKEKFA